MNKKSIILGLLAIIAVIVAIGLVWNARSSGPEPEPTDVTELSADPVTFSIDEIKSHDSREDCWTVITGNVYDITNYISSHPGGDAVLRACGADGTTLFATRTTNDGEVIGSGTAHSEEAFKTLDQFYIGAVEPEL